jgi:hypothetical protein
METEWINDIICSVLAKESTIQTVEMVLNTFLTEYEKLDPKTFDHPFDERRDFESEDELLRFYFHTKGLDQTFYWKGLNNELGSVLVGARTTSDQQLIISLTFDGTLVTENNYFNKLKSVLNSEVGVVSYVNPPEYQNGNDFLLRYR